MRLHAAAAAAAAVVEAAAQRPDKALWVPPECISCSHASVSKCWLRIRAIAAAGAAHWLVCSKIVQACELCCSAWRLHPCWALMLPHTHSNLGAAASRWCFRVLRVSSMEAGGAITPSVKLTDHPSRENPPGALSRLKFQRWLVVGATFSRAPALCSEGAGSSRVQHPASATPLMLTDSRCWPIGCNCVLCLFAMC
jgi:hypothetical protein